MCTDLTDKAMYSVDVISAAKAAAVVGMCRSRVCRVGSREVSEKAGALILIGMERQNDPDHHDGRLRRETLLSSDPLSLSAMVDDIQVFMSRTVYRCLKTISPFLASSRSWKYSSCNHANDGSYERLCDIVIPTSL